MVWTRCSCARNASRPPKDSSVRSATSPAYWWNGGRSATSAADRRNGGDQLPAHRGRNGRPPDPLRGLIRGHRVRDEEALDRVAAERGETLTGLRILDAF